MAEFRRILMVLFLILMIHFTANQQFSYITVRDGDDVTLPCENVINGQEKCDRTEWSFDHVDLRSAKLLFRHGQIETSQIPNSKSDRLSVTEKCSLVIKKVTDEDVGRYYCNQQHDEAAYVQLSVVTMNEHKSGNQDILYCTVWTYQHCGHTIKWLFDHKPIEENNSNMNPSQLDCYSTLTVLDSHFIHTSNNYSSLKCEVTDTNSGKVQLFPFRLQSSGDKTASTNPTSSTETTLKSSTGTTANDGVAQQFSYITVRDGDDVTLPCENVKNGQEKCDRTEWSLDRVDFQSAKLLFRHGQIETSQISKSKSDRLSVTEKCSLVMKKVTNNDVGRYSCKQQQDEAAYVQLSVVTMNEHKSGNQDILSCTVWTYQHCGHTIKWLFDHKPIEENNSNMKPSQINCYSTLTVLDSHFIHTSNNYSSLKCEVTDTNSGKVQLFPFRLQSSGDKTASTNPTSSTETTLKSSTGTTANDGDVDTKTATTKSTEYTTESSTNQGGSTGTSDAATKLQGLLRLIIVSVGLTALIIIVVTVEVWSRTKVLGPPDAVHGQTTADGKDCRPE